MTRKRLKPPTCLHCTDVEAVLVGAAVIYPRRGDLAGRSFWQCPDCGAYCGCHKGTKKALGRPANAALRDAHIKLHGRIDPIWTGAVEEIGYRPENGLARKIILNTARSRTYAFLADRLGIDKKACHVAMFDLDTCRRAWTAMFRVTYTEIRDWAKSKKAAEALDVVNEKAARHDAGAAV